MALVLLVLLTTSVSLCLAARRKLELLTLLTVSLLLVVSLVPLMLCCSSLLSVRRCCSSALMSPASDLDLLPLFPSLLLLSTDKELLLTCLLSIGNETLLLL